MLLVPVKWYCNSVSNHLLVMHEDDLELESWEASNHLPYCHFLKSPMIKLLLECYYNYINDEGNSYAWYHVSFAFCWTEHLMIPFALPFAHFHSKDLHC